MSKTLRDWNLIFDRGQMRRIWCKIILCFQRFVSIWDRSHWYFFFWGVYKKKNSYFQLVKVDFLYFILHEEPSMHFFIYHALNSARPIWHLSVLSAHHSSSPFHSTTFLLCLPAGCVHGGKRCFHFVSNETQWDSVANVLSSTCWCFAVCVGMLELRNMCCVITSDASAAQWTTGVDLRCWCL